MRDRAVALLSGIDGVAAERARAAESGAYRWALRAADARRVPKSWACAAFERLYVGKVRSLASNMDARSYVGNAGCAGRNAEGLAGMRPHELFPERWRAVMEIKARRETYIATAKPAAMTTQFRCNRCGKRECSYMELQTRSCDEPMSVFVSCLTCGNRWRMG
jgi:hypothetical protein